jgi:hypothetical protein
MNTQPTPETDREDIIVTKGKPTHWVSQEFARRLERERDEAREELAAVTTQRDRALEDRNKYMNLYYDGIHSIDE